MIRASSVRSARWTRLTVIACLAVLVCCKAPAPEQTAEITVRAALSTDPMTLSLIGKSDRYTEMVAFQITDSLVRLDARMRPVPRLAESWEVSADGTVVTFRLRDGVRWQDGRPVTADDVVFTINKVLEPATEATNYLSMFEDVASVEAPDPRTVRVVYARPNADFIEGWTVPILPEHLAGVDEDLLTGEFSRRPVGCGPFRFVRHEPGRELVLEANEDYWDGPPTIDRLVFRILPDERTQYQALLAGELDLVAAPPAIWREARTDPRASHLERLVYDRLSVWYVAWNQRRGPFFRDAGVRRAMVHALDRETFAEQVLEGLGKPGDTTYPPQSVWADPATGPLTYDPEMADELLREAGWTDTDGDGVRDRDGVPFRIEVLYPRGTQQLVDRIAAWIQQSLSEIGVEASLRVLEWRAFVEQRNEGRFDAAMSGWALSPFPDQTQLYHSGSMEDGLNFFGLSDPEVDRLLERGRTLLREDDRIPVYRALHRRLHELQPVTCLFQFASPVLHRPELGGIVTSPIDIYRTEPGPKAWTWNPEP